MSDNSDIRLISLETGGNQAYIFATNKLRNVVGASELLYRAGTSYVEEAVKEAVKEVMEEAAKEAAKEAVKEAVEEVIGREFSVNDDILNEKRIEENSEILLEVIIATSGKAMLLARGKDTARRFVKAWSKIVVKKAPGMDAVAVFSDTPVDLSLPLSSDDKHSYMNVFRETERNMSFLRMGGRTSPMVRFQRLPIVADCAFSGLPAVCLDNAGHLLSASSKAQRDIVASDKALQDRLRKLYIDERQGELKISGLSSLEKCDWLAVVHADGNGLGQLFINFDELVSEFMKHERKKENADGRDYIDLYRRFSSSLDVISRDAFTKTVFEIWPEDKADIVPIVVGGDDLTAVMDGRKSIEFAERFMKNFCSRTKEDKDVSDILRFVKDQELPRLGMCAGISIAKPHFPFSQSYRMAEELMKNAKLVKNKFGKDSIALDFHILYDSVSTSVDDIRGKLIRGDEDEVMLTAKPYVVERGNTRDPAMENDDEWEVLHSFDDFRKAVNAMRTQLPSSQSHSVRESLFSEDKETQEAEWKFLLSTYDKFAGEWHKIRGEELYIEAKCNGSSRYFTYFLDALEAESFMSKNREEGESSSCREDLR